MSESPKPEGYVLTESDIALIYALSLPGSGGNIAAVYFDGQLLVDMVTARRELGEKLRRD